MPNVIDADIFEVVEERPFQNRVSRIPLMQAYFELVEEAALSEPRKPNSIDAGIFVEERPLSEPRKPNSIDAGIFVEERPFSGPRKPRNSAGFSPGGRFSRTMGGTLLKADSI